MPLKPWRTRNFLDPSQHTHFMKTALSACADAPVGLFGETRFGPNARICAVHRLLCKRGRRAEARRQGGSPAPQVHLKNWHWALLPAIIFSGLFPGPGLFPR